MLAVNRARIQRLLSRKAYVAWVVLILSWAWKGAQAISTLDFLRLKIRPMIDLLESHPNLVITLTCFGYLAFLVLQPEKNKVQDQTKGTPITIPSICVEACSVEGCAYEGPSRIGLGNTHEIALVDFLNDPKASYRNQVKDVSAKVTYYDSGGRAYRIVDKALWLGEAHPSPFINIGFSKKLVVAILDPAGRAFTIDQRYERAVMPFYIPTETNLKSGTGRVVVRLSYSYSSGYDESQTFDFKLNVGKQLELECAPTVPAAKLRY